MIGGASHAADLELARRCAAGRRARVGAVRAASTGRCSTAPPTRSIARGGAREIADSLYAELYGINGRRGARQSLFRYFQGRSSLATWLRAVLAQRYVDRLRAQRRLEPLPDEDGTARPGGTRRRSPDPRSGALCRRWCARRSARAVGRLAGARSASARLLLRAGADARRNRPGAEGARSHRRRASWRGRGATIRRDGRAAAAR